MQSPRQSFESRLLPLCSLLLWLFASPCAHALGAPLASAAGGGSEGVARRKPNVILIYTDDQGAVDAGCFGADDLHTPHMDALAAQGLRLTNMHAPAPVCSPSRAGLLTGRYPVRAGVPGNISSQPGRQGMPSEQRTIAEVFRDNGYHTAHIGKWHLGYSSQTMPLAQGFEHSFGHMGGCIDNYSHFFYWNGPNRHDLWRNGKEVFEDGRYFPDLMVEEATRLMESWKDEPFFMYFAINAPHYPYQGELSWLARYADVDYPRNLYGAFLSSIDARIGMLMEHLAQLGLEEDTIVIVQSDHGHSLEARAHGGGGSAGPYRGSKFSMFEGGLRVPSIIRWKGHLASGEARDQLTHGCDWLPTLADLCELSIDALDLDGKSLTSVLRSADAPTPHAVLHWQTGGAGGQWVVREGDWKLIANPWDPGAQDSLDKENDKLFLVNVVQDVGERVNVAAKRPELVQRLSALHATWAAGVKRELDAAR